MLAAGAVWKVRPLVPPPCTPPGHPSPEEQGMSDRDRGLELPGARARDGIAAQAFAAPRVFVVSDMRLYRDFLVHELVLSGTVDLIGAAPAADAAAQVVALQPDILLLDVEASGARRLSTGLRPLTQAEDLEAVERINASGADIVWIGLSTPKQERWMAEHRALLRAPVLLGVGAAFDFHAGRVRQAPALLQRSGLEWLFRLAMEPRRLWRRYLRNNPAFVMLLLAQKTGLRRWSLE